MSYLDETLTTGEVVLYRTGLHWTVLFWPVVVGLLFAAAAAGLFVAASRGAGGVSSPWTVAGGVCALVAIVAVVTGAIRRSSIEMAVTNRRVLMKVGILGRKTVELMLTKIESIGVEQGIAGRMAGYGKVVVRGTGGTYEVFDRIARPLEFRRQVQEQIGQGPPAQERLTSTR